MLKGRQATVVDTNVPIIANRRYGESYACASACASELLAIKERGYLLVDDQDLILSEYRKYLNHSGQPGVGDAFFRWFFNDRWKSDLCRMVSIRPISDGWRRFEEFPDDTTLQGFDPADQKFVATANTIEIPAHILQAADHKWLNWHMHLKRHGIIVRFLCEHEVQKTSALKTVDGD